MVNQNELHIAKHISESGRKKSINSNSNKSDQKILNANLTIIN